MEMSGMPRAGPVTAAVLVAGPGEDRDTPPPLPIQPMSGRSRAPLPLRNMRVPPTAVTSGSLAGQPMTSGLYRLLVL